MNFENDLRTRAEKLVLCALMQDNGSIRHIEMLKPQHFSHDTHGQIFRHIVKLIAMGEPADACSVFSSMDRRRQLRRAGLFGYRVQYVTGFADGTCPASLLLAILEFVGDAYENREAQQSSQTINDNPRAIRLIDPFRITFGV